MYNLEVSLVDEHNKELKNLFKEQKVARLNCPDIQVIINC